MVKYKLKSTGRTAFVSSRWDTGADIWDDYSRPLTAAATDGYTIRWEKMDYDDYWDEPSSFRWKLNDCLKDVLSEALNKSISFNFAQGREEKDLGAFDAEDVDIHSLLGVAEVDHEE